MYTIFSAIQEFIMTHPYFTNLLIICLALVLTMFIKDRHTRKASYETLFLLAFVLTFMMLLETPFAINVLTHPMVSEISEEFFKIISLIFSLFMPDLWGQLLFLWCGLSMSWAVFKHERMNNYPQGIKVAILKATLMMVSIWLTIMGFFWLGSFME